MKNWLFSTVAFFLAYTSHTRLEAQQNLFPRGDFSQVTTVDNLWDGVNRNNQINVPPASRETPRQNATVSSLAHPASADLFDITNDGLPDLVVASPEGYIWVFRNSGEPGKPKFTRGEIIPFLTYLSSRWGTSIEAAVYIPRIHVTNWSSGTSPDIIIGTFFGEIFRVPVANSGGRISYRNFDPARQEIRLASQPNIYFMNLADPFVVDWDGDGKKDLIVGEGSFSANTVLFFKNLGTDASPRFDIEQMVQLIAARGNEQLKPAALDWNGDGRLDLFVTDEKGDAIIYLRKADGTLDEGRPVQAGGRNFGPMASVKPADFNGDGLFDLIIGGSNGQVRVALNTGTKEAPAFAAPTNIMGEDFLMPYERPIGWSLRAHPHTTYIVLDTFDDPNNTQSPSASGGKCLRIYFLDPQNAVVSGQISPQPQNPQTELRSSSSVRLELGKSYEVSFRYSSTGFTRINWRLQGNIISSQRGDANVTRRGEVRSGGGNIGLGQSVVQGELRNSGWTSVRETLRVPNPQNAMPNVSHELEFRFTGIGTFTLDDIVIRPL